MSMSDPIADMLTRIRNAQATEKASVFVPSSKVKQAIAQVLKDEGYIEDFALRDLEGKAFIEIGLKYYAGKPVIEKIDPDSSPILSVMVAGDRPVRELTEFAENVVEERIQRIPGVGSVTRTGGREREIRIWLDADRLRSYALTADDVIRAVRSEHAEIPGGTLESAARTAEFSVKTKGEVEAVREFGDVVVAYREGAPTTVGDVARVEDGAEDERSWAELEAHARSLAGWWGIDKLGAALIAVPAGIVTLLLASLVMPRRVADTAP